VKILVKVCKCGRIYKWGVWYTFKELTPKDKFDLLTAYNQSRVNEVVEVCNYCKEVQYGIP